MSTASMNPICLLSSQYMRQISKSTELQRKVSRRTGNGVCRKFSTTQSKRKDEKAAVTPLYDLHVAHGGKMVAFAGYSLPVQYGNASITESHLHTRSKSSLFDVSHMLQTEITGSDSIQLLESVCVADVQNLAISRSSLSVFTSENGGIEDDFVVTRTGEKSLYVVSNAARKKVISTLLKSVAEKFKSQGKEVTVTFLEPEERALLAIQGPESARLLQPLVNFDLSSFYFMTSAVAPIKGGPQCRITRCGYTGEDGFEISIDSDKAQNFVQSLLEKYPDALRLAGLGARDSLRIEAGLCLYGNEIDVTTTPVEAGLTWTIGKIRRERADFPGANVILQQIKNGASKQRVGLLQDGKGLCPRTGSEIKTQNDEPLGKVTSGCPSPSLKTNIAMGYVAKSSSKPGTQIKVKIRDVLTTMTIQKMPFVPAKYFTKPKK